jgi:hypothetical protein
MSKLLPTRFVPPPNGPPWEFSAPPARGGLATRSLFGVLFDPALGLYVLVVISLVACADGRLQD